MRLSLQGWATLWIAAAMIAGAVAAIIWTSSAQAWRSHLDSAYLAGRGLAQSLLYDSPPPAAISLARIFPQAPIGTFAPTHRDAGLPASARATTLSLRQRGADDDMRSPGKRLLIHVLSDRLQYPVASIDGVAGAAEGLASLSRQMALHCSDSTMFLQDDDGRWWRADSALWSCDHQPRDLRLWAVALAVAALVLLWGHARDLSSGFRDLAIALAGRTRMGQMEDLQISGPIELRQTIEAVNAYLSEERDRLARRSLVLSGVSHDLGTPATRLRLRVAMIDDPDLREKFTADLDKMAAMIEEVLTFTRAEIAAEPESDFSFVALVQSVVADYQDTGRPVTLVLPQTATVGPTGSVFGTSGGRKRAVTEGRRMLFRGRPVALERALSNLIDNALKYGRRAQVRLLRNSARIIVEIQDEGRELDPETLARLTEPFARGRNQIDADGHPVSGFGMGLSTVATIAAQHGGQLEFEQTPQGLCARLTLPRETHPIHAPLRRKGRGGN
jgi:two-component system, OmpR family, osmolarity sensor histidine kinase EnvZ